MLEFKNVGELCRSVRNAKITKTADPKLRLVQNLNKGVGSEGGFLVGEKLSTLLINKMYESSKLASRCKRVFVEKNAGSYTFPKISETGRVDGSRHGGISGQWTPERGAIPASMPRIGAIEQKLNKLSFLVYASNELLEDCSYFDQLIGDLIGSEAAFMIDNSILRGTGAGQPQGILNSGSLITVQPEVAQAPNTIVFENILNMLQRVDARGFDNLAWFVNVDTLPQIYSMVNLLGVGGSQVAPVADFGGKGLHIAGIPVHVIEQASTVGSVGDILLGNFQEYTISERQVSTAISGEVQYLTDESAFRFSFRLDGSPDWAEPITPARGAAGVTVSPFVVLGERA